MSTDPELKTFRQNVALELARECGWNECIETRLTFVKGETADGGPKGNRFVVRGGIERIDEEVNVEKVLSMLESRPWIGADIESNVRRKAEEGTRVWQRSLGSPEARGTERCG